MKAYIQAKTKNEVEETLKYMLNNGTVKSAGKISKYIHHYSRINGRLGKPVYWFQCKCEC